MNSVLTTNDPNYVVKEEIEISETVMQEQRLEAALKEDTADENVTSGSGRTNEAKQDSTQHCQHTQHDKENARKVAISFQCPTCLMGFSNRKLAQSHMRQFHGDPQSRPESCPICSRNFKYQSVLFVHMNNHREKVCSICNVVVSGSEALKNHVRSLHIDKPEFVCGICFKLIDNANHEDHLNSHKGRRRYECVDCSKYYASLRGLERHRHIHVGIIKNKLRVQYKCSICSKAYASRRNLRVHMNSHNEMRPYKCDQCPKNFLNRQALQGHCKTHLNFPRNNIKKKHKCSYCLKYYSSRQHLCSHVNTHIGARPFKCDECPKDYASPQGLLAHRQRHLSRGGSVKCSVCSKTLNNWQSLRFHMNIHNDTRPYKCEQCPKNLSSPSALSTHRQRHLIDHNRLKCSICSKIFCSTEKLRFHMNIHAGTRPYKCNQCPKSFPSPGSLTRHRQIHLPGYSPVKCTICFKTLSDSRRLRFHMNIHTGARPYQCDQCPNNYASSEALQNHRKTHIDLPSKPRKIKERNYKCSICSKTLSCAQSLRFHMNIHTGRRPYKCDQCPNSFASSWVLGHHRQRHSERDKFEYKCHVCSNVFTKQRSLNLHFSRNHDASFKCNKCEKSYASRGGLVQHHRDNPSHGGYEHKCSICSKGFFFERSLNNHMKTHLEAPLHKCDVCTREFYSTTSLRRHRRIHLTHGKNPHKSPVRYETFTDQQSLVPHMNTHPGLRRYKCNQCPKDYASRSALKVHLKKHSITPGECKADRSDKSLHDEGKDGKLDKVADLHTTLAKYKCKECDKGFISERNLSFHIRQHVKEITPSPESI